MVYGKRKKKKEKRKKKKEKRKKKKRRPGAIALKDFEFSTINYEL